MVRAPAPDADSRTARRGSLAARQARHPLGRRELACPICGYRVVVDRHPDRCPMCGGDQWQFAGWRPFGAPGQAERRDESRLS